MKAEKIDVLTGPTYVIVRGTTGVYEFNPDQVITIEGSQRSSIADGIVKMINESQCLECGQFNGLHGSVYVKNFQGPGGEVSGRFVDCSKAERS